MTTLQDTQSESKTTDVKERGAASVFIELKDGVITVTHGTDHVVLTQWIANKGDWEHLWRRIAELNAAA